MWWSILKTFLAIICFGIGVALAVNTVAEFKKEYWSHPELPAMFSAMFLLGAFLLLRRRTPPPAP